MMMRLLRLFMVLLLLYATPNAVWAQGDPVMVTDFEGDDFGQARAWDATESKIVANPVSDGVNSSANCVEFIRKTQWASAIEFINYAYPVSLYSNPQVKFKFLNKDKTAVNILMYIVDINGKEIKGSTQISPANQDVWVEYTYDLTEFVTPSVSFIREIELRIDYGSTDLTGKYYIDDLQFTGDNVTLTLEEDVAVFNEIFTNNGWWMSDPVWGSSNGVNGHYLAKDSIISKLRTAAWGGSALKAAVKHYNAADSMIMVMLDNSGHGSIELIPAAERPFLSFLTIKELSIDGVTDLIFTYDLRWGTAPANIATDAPDIEYSLDGGEWTPLTRTGGTLPTQVGGLWNSAAWATGLEYEFPDIDGTSMKLRITNNATGDCYLDNLKIEGLLVYDYDIANSITISGGDAISDFKGTLQLTSATLPNDISQEAYWYVSDGESVTVDSNTGLVTALGGFDGEVTIAAIARDITGLHMDSHTITLSNQIKEATAITITSAGDATTITTDNGTLQLTAAITPEDATDQSVVWEVDDDTKATISESGLLTALGNGTVLVKVTANGGTDVTNTFQVVISGQIIDVESVAISSAGDATTISTDDGTLQLTATVSPENATDKTVSWSVDDESKATISNTGLLTALDNGSVVVTATANGGVDIKSTFNVTISGQIILVNSIVISSAGDATSVMSGEQLQLSALVGPENATDKSISWSSEDELVATVNAEGLVTGISGGTIMITATANDASGKTGTFSITVNQTVVASVGSDSSTDVIIYPVPVNNVLNISSLSQIESVKIFNMNGQLLLSGNKAIMDLSILDRGGYIVQIQTNQSMITRRIFK